ncbi:MAG: periplasmic heavy metal sensor [Alphaproteobacteria bacterium]|nr:periplasmic heavy metal sensor [Alphaproteobacteria bacterium]
MSDPLAAAPDTPRRGPGVLLIVSLAFNVALIGLTAIMWLRLVPPPPHEHDARGLNPMALMRMVPAEQDRIQAVMDRHHARIRELHQHAMQARRELFGVIAAKDFDRAAFDKAMAEVQSADSAFEAESATVTAESVELLTPEERQSVAEQVRKPRGWLRKMFRRP